MKAEDPKTLIITGGASGIGFAFSEHLALMGHRVLIADLHGANEAAERLRKAGLQAAGVTADVVKEDDAAAMVAAGETVGPYDNPDVRSAVSTASSTTPGCSPRWHSSRLTRSPTPSGCG